MKKLLLLAFLALFLFPVAASHSQSQLVNLTTFIQCTSQDVTDDGYTLCIVEGGTSNSMFGTISNGYRVTINEVRFQTTRVSSANTILLLRNSELSVDDVSLNFSGFDSIVLENTDVTVEQRGIAFYPVRYFNATNSNFNVKFTTTIQATYVNLQAIQMASSNYGPRIYAPFINGTSSSSITGDHIYLFDHALDQPAPATLGKISFLGDLIADNAVRVHGDNSNVYLRKVNGSTIQIIGNNVFLGNSASTSSGSSDRSIGHGGAGATNVTIFALHDFTQYKYWPIYGRNISIYSGGNMVINDDIDAFSTVRYGQSSPGQNCFQGEVVDLNLPEDAATIVVVRGQIALAGAGSLTLATAADLFAENCRTSGSAYTSVDVPSIRLNFSNGNVLIRGSLNTYNDAPVYDPRRNAIRIIAGNLVIQDNAEFKIHSAGLVKITAPSLTISNSVVSPTASDIRGNLGEGFGDEDPLELYTCSSSGIPSIYVDRGYFHRSTDFSSVCPNPRPLNLYGYLTTPAGSLYVAGSAKVNSIRVAIPNGPYVLNSTNGNFTDIYRDIFTARNGFFSFSIPDVPLTRGAYRVNVTFSTNSSYNCTTGGACQNREVIATALPG